MDIGYARVSRARQELAGSSMPLHPPASPKCSRTKRERSHYGPAGLHSALEHASDGDVIVVHTMDSLGRTVRDTLNLMRELEGCGVGVRTLADTLRIGISNADSPMAQLVVGMLALFAEMERTYAAERAVHAPAVATANGRRTGRPPVVDAAKLEHAFLLREKGAPMREIVAKTGLARTTLYRYLPPRSPAHNTGL
ncbi:recombinase family protein [Paenarthrobacter sp. NPDC089714]|uniref:recombinase family protein n=1 Tax=Paenarthrobacter sp. NPDC089714 TaxID=3364377 RepID=UPI00382C4EE7